MPDLPMFDASSPLGPPGSLTRKEQVRRYFRQSPDPGLLTWSRRLLTIAAAAFVSGAALLLAGERIPAALLAILFAVTLVQGLALQSDYRRRYRWAEPTPSPHAMDDALEADKDRARKRALTRFGLEPPDKAPPPSYVVIGPSRKCSARRGADGTWRFNAYEVMVICPTDRRYAVYQAILDAETGGLKQERTSELYYGDVIAVITAPPPPDWLVIHEPVLDIHPVPLGRCAPRLFEIVAPSADRCAIAVLLEPAPDRRLYLQPSGLEAALGAVRLDLASRKGGGPPPPSS